MGWLERKNMIDP